MSFVITKTVILPTHALVNAIKGIPFFKRNGHLFETKHYTRMDANVIDIQPEYTQPEYTRINHMYAGVRFDDNIMNNTLHAFVYCNTPVGPYNIVLNLNRDVDSEWVDVLATLVCVDAHLSAGVPSLQRVINDYKNRAAILEQIT